jgi:hypothetical protein
MSNSIVQHDIASLLDSWIEAERSGVQFPVPFEAAYSMAGYTRKDNAKRSLPKSAQGILYLISSIGTKGRPKEQISLSVPGLEHLCLMADTPEGHEIREYFRDARSKWELTKQVAPNVAEDVEIMHLKIELAKIEMQRAALEDKTISLRHYIVTALPKPTADRILGVTEVREIEYRDRIVKDGVVINDGGTINKTEICKRFGILTKNGKPDYPRLNKSLSSMELPESAWVESEVVQTNRELKREYLEVLDRALYSAKERQLFLGENQ